ncbi:universal stress protein [Natronococcus pandeyae]|uniref:Universal stress protein n=1 Tax=Natronococcus pandeyae TaxID=2055836 RepID=A0A8J8Q3M0_9EURY|nr:universal stress protein [Natronococcus pandeyae]TYL36495.1 universal stress protein [Natronococcus pandeyae]
MFQNILCPVDGSDAARNAADQAIEMATEIDASVHFLYVIESKPTFTRVGLAGLEDESVSEKYESHAEQTVRDLVHRADESGVEAVSAVKSGQPYAKIVEYAENNAIDVIVIGAHGYDWGGVSDAVLGSTTERVARRAPVSVLVAR